MDMVLYALIKQKIKDKLPQMDNVGGYEIRIVDTLPNTTEENTIYFIMGEGSENDGIVIGKSGLQNIAFNNTMVDYMVLNGNIIMDRYDSLRGLTRKIFSSLNNGYLECSPTVDGEKFDELTITSTAKGETVITGIKVYGLSSSTEQNPIFLEMEEVLYSLPNGYGDTLNILSGELTQSVIADVIDERVTWTNIALYGDYREFRMSGYVGNIRPMYLTYGGLFNGEIIESFDGVNAYATNGFDVINSSENKNRPCIYVSNSVIRVRILNSLLDTSLTLAKAMQKYVTENPITVVMQLKNPVTEQILEPQELITYQDITQIEVVFTGDSPTITAKLPIKEDELND